MILVSGVVYFSAPSIGTKLWKNAELVPLIRWAVLLGAVATIASVSQTYFQSFQRFRVNAVVGICQRMIDLAGISVLALLAWWSAGLVMANKIVCAVVGGLAFLCILPREAYFKPKGDQNAGTKKLGTFLRPPEISAGTKGEIEAVKPHSFAFYLFLSGLFVMLHTRFATWFLGAFSTTSEVGIYSVAIKFALPLVFVSNAINAALWPRMAGRSTGDGLLSLARGTLRVTIPVTAVSTAYALVAPLAAPFVFGEAYGASILPAQLTCLAYCVVILTNPIGVIAYGFELAKFFAFVNFLQTAIAIPLLITLVPSFGAIGTAVTQLVIIIVGGILTSYILLAQIRRKRGWTRV